jgi:VWFA-related protein
LTRAVVPSPVSRPPTVDSVEARSPAPQAGDAPPIQSAEDEQRAAREADTRVIAVFLDDFHVAAGDETTIARETIQHFVDTNLRPRDLLLVLRPLDPVVGLRFTRDRDAARATVAAFAGRRDDFAPRTAFEEQFIGRAPEAAAAARAQVVTSALRELTMHIGELGATRAAIVVVSGGFVRATGPRARRLPDWQSLARAASHYNIPVYTLDPQRPAAPPTDKPRKDTPALEKPAPGKPAPENQMLRSLAADTGGEAVAGDAMSAALGRMARDLDAYYVLRYTPSEASDGTFHAIAIQARAKGAQVRAPSGYWSPMSAEWRAWFDKALAPVQPPSSRTLHKSPAIETWVGFVREQDGRMRLVFTWQPAAEWSGPRRIQAQIVALKATTVEGATLFENEVGPVPPIATDAENRDRAIFDIGAGRVQLDLTIRALDGSIVDTGALDIDPPAIRGTNPVILPLQIVRVRSARDFRLLTDAPDAPPSPSREFSRTERLLLRVPAFDPSGGAVTISAALVNGRGDKLRELPRLESTGAPQFDLPLGWLAPGEYGLEVTASSPAGVARQLLRVRITG